MRCIPDDPTPIIVIQLQCYLNCLEQLDIEKLFMDAYNGSSVNLIIIKGEMIIVLIIESYVFIYI